jgi:hypothetical protein
MQLPAVECVAQQKRTQKADLAYQRCLACEVVAMKRTLLPVAIAALVGSLSSAAEGLLPTLETTGLSSADVARLLEQLDAPEFGDRQDASRRLSEGGKAVLPDLEKAVATASREVSSRSLDILKQHYQQGDAELKQAAKESLARLSENKSASIAQRARNVIDPPKQVAANMPVGAGGFGGFRGPAIPMPVVPPARFPPPPPIVPAALAPAVRSISISEINGNREVKIDDQTRVTTMQSRPGGPIDITVHDKIRNEQVKSIKATDLDDLKAKDAELAQIYERYQQQGRAAVIGPPMPVRPPGAPAGSSDLAKRMLETIESNIERYKGRLPNDPAAQRTIDSLERLKQQYRSLLPQESPPARALETARRPTTR